MLFFDSLKNDIKDLGNEIILIGGDWNATWDMRDPEENLDVLNMVGIPSLRRSRKIHEIATELKLTETYRIFIPNHREYTYIPSAAGNANRSRLDFFLISEKISHLLTSSIIPPALNSTVFDHKKITISFKRKNGARVQIIRDTLLNDPDLDAYVLLSVTDCYMNHTQTGVDFSDADKELIQRQVGYGLSALKQKRDLKLERLIRGAELADTDVLDGVINFSVSVVPTIEFLNNLTLTSSPDNFFEALVSVVRGEVLGFQSSYFKQKKARINLLGKNLKTLKIDYVRNRDEIEQKERELNRLIEEGLRDVIRRGSYR